MKLTEQEQAAVSRGMIEGLLRALHAEGVLPPERLELVLELLCARPLTCCAWPPIAVFPPCRRTRETHWRISGDIFRSTSAVSRTGSLWRFMRTRVCPVPRPTGLPFGACWQRQQKRKLT